MQRFKNFQDAELVLGPLTVLIGTNASGKTNILDAFRFLHGISRGYNLAEIIGEKWGEGGVLQWKGIRGGTREVTYMGAETFALGFETTIVPKHSKQEKRVAYNVEIEVGEGGKAPRVVDETLADTHSGSVFYRTSGTIDRAHIRVQLGGTLLKGRPAFGPFTNTIPILHQIADDIEFRPRTARLLADAVVGAISSFRFLDLSPTAMRLPSLPGQVVLGDKGENLSSVLLAICEDPLRKRVLLEWINELTPMDAQDFEFPADQTGRVLLTLVEQGGHRTTAQSASDGTLRFLAIIAAMLGSETASFYFFEELENGIHPTRLSLLLDLIERQVSKNKVQSLRRAIRRSSWAS
jgi:predicted ATPase